MILLLEICHFSQMNHLCFSSNNNFFFCHFYYYLQKVLQEPNIKGETSSFLYQLFPSIYSIGHLQNGKNFVLWFLTFSVVCKDVKLGGHILYICKASFSKLVFYVVLS